MGMTMTQKILAAHAGLPCVKAGDLIEAKLDIVLGNDVTTPVAVGVFDKAQNRFVCCVCLTYQSSIVTINNIRFSQNKFIELH